MLISKNAQTIVITGAFLTLSALPIPQSLGIAPDPAINVDPATASEGELIARIKRLDTLVNKRRFDPRTFAQRGIVKEQLVEEVGIFQKRFSESAFKDAATIIKLAALADLARSSASYLDQLMQATEAVSKSKAKEPLSGEADYFAIQAFVLAARAEQMPERRRHEGAAERYEGFVKDHPVSPHVPVIRASLIRSLIAIDRIDSARAVLSDLKSASPKHKATFRAAGELYRATAIGKPFSFERTASDGKIIRTQDYLGKVVLVHFWASWREASVNELPKLIKIHKRFKDSGVQLIGVNVDTDAKRRAKALEDNPMPWPLYFDEKGFDNDVLVEMGVIRIPTYFVIGRKGVLRAIDPSPDLEESVGLLLLEKK